MPEYTKHITLPNGYGMCVLDETYSYNKTLVPFSMLSVIPKDSPFDKKLHLLHNTMIGLKLKAKDIEVFKVILDNVTNMAEVKALELSLDKALSSDLELNLLAQHMVNIISTDSNGNPTLVDAPTSQEVLANYFHSVGTFNLMQQILTQTHNYAEVGTVNLLVKHIEVDADLALAKLAMNTYATTILKLPPIMSITSSDLAFFGVDKSSRSKYERELKNYFDDLHRLTDSTTDYVVGLAEQSSE